MVKLGNVMGKNKKRVREKINHVPAMMLTTSEQVALYICGGKIKNEERREDRGINRDLGCESLKSKQPCNFP